MHLLNHGRTKVLVANLTEPTCAAMDAYRNRLFVGVLNHIFVYNLTDSFNSTPPAEIFIGATPKALALDVWGNLFFVDDSHRTVNVMYYGNSTTTILYDNQLKISNPTAIAVDDFNEFLFWTNGADGDFIGSILVALKEPRQNGIGVMAAWLNRTSTQGLALSRNRIFISTNGTIMTANKLDTAHWREVSLNLTDPLVLAVDEGHVYVRDSSNLLYSFHEDERHPHVKLEENAPTGVTHASSILRSYAESLALVVWLAV